MFSFLSRFIKETLRIYPSVPIINRQLLKDVFAVGKCIKKGLVIFSFDSFHKSSSSGTLVSLSLIGAQRNPEVWENPLQFDPDRFKRDQTSRRNHHAFIPFSAGSRFKVQFPIFLI